MTSREFDKSAKASGKKDGAATSAASSITVPGPLSLGPRPPSFGPRPPAPRPSFAGPLPVNVGIRPLPLQAPPDQQSKFQKPDKSKDD